jgi:polar amino acid transport system substrate-binding protein
VSFCKRLASRGSRAFRLLLCVAALLSGCAQAKVRSGLERVRQTGVLRWGGDLVDGDPYVFEDPEHPGVLTGFETEIARALARELGVRAELVQNDWSTLVPSLERGTFDVILNGLEVTPARKQRIDFTAPYYVFGERLVARVGDTRVSDLASLRGLRVGTLASSLAWDVLEPTGAVRVSYESTEEPYTDLVHGRVDAVLLDDIVATRYGKRPGLRVVGDVAQGVYAIGVRRGERELRQALDDALNRMKRSGELRDILARWHLPGLPGNAPAHVAPAHAADPPHATFSLSPHQLSLFLQGAAITFAISSAAMLLAIALGLLLAIARMPSPFSLRRALSRAATAYVEVFRGTPVLLQLFLLYYGLAAVVAIDAFTAAVIGLGLNYAAYEAEIYRAGIAAVPRGEIEAAYALGMSGRMALRRVILPQAVRFSLPGMTNDFISLLKDSSLVSVITVVELTKRMTIAAIDGQSWLVPGALCALLYFAMSYPLSRLSRWLEARIGARH